LFNKMKPMRRLVHLRRINYLQFNTMARFVLKHQSKLMLSAVLLSSAFHGEVLRKKSYTVFPSDPDWRSKPRLDSSSYIWSGPDGENVFEFRYRFRRNDFMLVLQAMDLVSSTGIVKELLLGNAGHQWRLRFDTAFMILLRHLAYPARFGDHVDEFNMPSNRLCEAFHGMSDFLFVRYAYKLADLSRWTDMFPIFAQAFSRMGCPFDNNVALTDGNFVSI
jgi:hypothetical protein